MPWKLQTDDSEILVYHIKLRIMRIGNNLHPYKTVTQRSSLAQMALNYLDYVLNKAAEISIRVFSFFSFFFVISAGFLHCEPFYFLCRFRYRRIVNKTACSILWHSLSKFVLSLGSEFSRHPRGLRRFLLQVTGHRSLFY